MRYALLAAAPILLLLSNVGMSAAQQRRPIIDMHLHGRMGSALNGGKPAPHPCMPHLARVPRVLRLPPSILSA